MKASFQKEVSILSETRLYNSQKHQRTLGLCLFKQDDSRRWALSMSSFKFLWCECSTGHPDTQALRACEQLKDPGVTTEQEHTTTAWSPAPPIVYAEPFIHSPFNLQQPLRQLPPAFPSTLSVFPLPPLSLLLPLLFLPPFFLPFLPQLMLRTEPRAARMLAKHCHPCSSFYACWRWT